MDLSSWQGSECLPGWDLSPASAPRIGLHTALPCHGPGDPRASVTCLQVFYGAVCEPQSQQGGLWSWSLYTPWALCLIAYHFLPACWHFVPLKASWLICLLWWTGQTTLKVLKQKAPSQSKGSQPCWASFLGLLVARWVTCPSNASSNPRPQSRQKMPNTWDDIVKSACRLMQ